MAVLTVSDANYTAAITYTTSGPTLHQYHDLVVGLNKSFGSLVAKTNITHLLVELVAGNEFKCELTHFDARTFKQRLFGSPGTGTDVFMTFDVTDQWKVSEIVSIIVVRFAVIELMFGSATLFATKIEITKL